jgi:hypothetical protein
VEWLRIRDEDRYRLIPRDEVRVGDLVVYRDRERVEPGAPETDLLHFALVVGVERVGEVPVPFALSKWGSTFGEDRHRFDDVPFEEQGFRLRIEFWTDRPSDDGGAA